MTTLTPEEEAQLRPIYDEYLERCRDTRSTKERQSVFPMSFDAWWRAMADEIKERRPGK